MNVRALITGWNPLDSGSHRPIAINNCPGASTSFCTYTGARFEHSHRYSCGRKEISWIPDSYQKSTSKQYVASSSRCFSSTSRSRRRVTRAREKYHAVHQPLDSWPRIFFSLSRTGDSPTLALLVPEGLLINDRGRAFTRCRVPTHLVAVAVKGRRDRCRDLSITEPSHYG